MSDANEEREGASNVAIGIGLNLTTSLTHTTSTPHAPHDLGSLIPAGDHEALVKNGETIDNA